MEVFKSIKPVRTYLQKQRSLNKKIGLVPTMGALHEGHLSLLRASLRENNLTVCSIFVNPTQFDNSEDLRLYPRPLDKDLQMLEQEGCDAVFIPQADDIYPSDPIVQLSFGYLEEVLEGKYRQGHFHGVGLVVSKLFNILGPDAAYFGQKDLQQFAIIRQLVEDLSFPVQLRRMPIVREKDGLAMSSRNVRLNEKERETALALYASLQQGKKAMESGMPADEIINDSMKWLESQGVKPQYFSIVDPETMKNVVNHFSEKSVALCVAGFVGPVRLIDNLVIEK
jgi:pantoate--beta-alanine ligase